MNKHEARLKHQREYRRKNHNACTNKYEKTINGFLVRKYRNMQSRVDGVQWLKAHLYKNLTILDRTTFYEWSRESGQFHKLYKAWVKSGFQRKICPSVNRIDSKKGYQLANMEWITHSENSRLGSLSRNKMKV